MTTCDNLFECDDELVSSSTPLFSNPPICTYSPRNSNNEQPSPPPPYDDHTEFSDTNSMTASQLKPRRSSTKTHSRCDEPDEKTAAATVSDVVHHATNNDSKTSYPRWHDKCSKDEDPERLDQRERPSSKRALLCLINFIVLIALFLCLGNSYYYSPRREEENLLATAVAQRPSVSDTTHLPLQFSHLNLVADLPSKHLPGRKHGHSAPGRLVVVGDVHGMVGSLEALLAKLNFDKNVDHLVLSGDMISKGPDSVGVVKLAMDIGATCVRGNHEDRVLLAYKGLESNDVDSIPTAAVEGLGDHRDENEGSLYPNHHPKAEVKCGGKCKDRTLAAQFSHKQIKWLQACPVILRVGEITNFGEVVVVHAGLVPGVKLSKQDPYMVMNMRSINPGSWVPSDSHNGSKHMKDNTWIDWYKLWNKFQKKQPKSERTTVIYGHDSKRGLQKTKYTRGLDTACLKGGRLTALVIEQGKRGKMIENMVQVECPDGRKM